MPPSQISRMTVAAVMACWPATVQVFNARGMACPGCVMAPFMSVAEAAGAYRLDEAGLCRDLIAASVCGRAAPRRSSDGERTRR